MTRRRRLYGLYGRTCRDFLTYGGLILVHDDKAELAYLFPITRRGAVSYRELPRDIPISATLSIRNHPQMGFVQWTAEGRLKAQVRDARGVYGSQFNDP